MYTCFSGQGARMSEGPLAVVVLAWKTGHGMPGCMRLERRMSVSRDCDLSHVTSGVLAKCFQISLNCLSKRVVKSSYA